MSEVLRIPINLNEIQFNTNDLNIIVENKLYSCNYLHEWMKAVRLSKSLINVLIYDERKYVYEYYFKIYKAGCNQVPPHW